MHVEILTEDSSTKHLLERIIPDLCQGRYTYRIISYKGIGRIPKDLKSSQDPSKRVLLDQIPRLLKGYDKTPGIDCVLVVLDTDSRPCKDFLSILNRMVSDLNINLLVKFRLAIEETEAWFLGDRAAIKKAYPNARMQALASYAQDAVCDTWEKLADCTHPGGAAAVKRIGWPLPGQLKHEWVSRITPHFDMENNQSPSFQKLRSFLLAIE